VQCQDNCQGTFQDNDVICGGATITERLSWRYPYRAGIVNFIVIIHDRRHQSNHCLGGRRTSDSSITMKGQCQAALLVS